MKRHCICLKIMSGKWYGMMTLAFVSLLITSFIVEFNVSLGFMMFGTGAGALHVVWPSIDGTSVDWGMYGWEWLPDYIVLRSSTMLIVPIYMPCIAMMCVCAMRYRSLWKKSGEVCVQCGYSREGLAAAVCPECGSAVLAQSCDMAKKSV